MSKPTKTQQACLATCFYFTDLAKDFSHAEVAETARMLIKELQEVADEEEKLAAEEN